MTLSTVHKGWAVVQVTALVLAVSGVAFPAAASAHQYQSGHDQTFNNEGNESDRSDNQDDNGGHVKGSITVCKILVDANGTVIDGSSLSSGHFSIALSKGDYSASASFDLPLTFDTGFISGDQNDAECQTFSDLKLGSYDYGQESVSCSATFDEPMYNDQFTQEVNSLSDFYTYNEDGNGDNADGVITLTKDRPDRTLVVLNRLTAPVTPPPPSTANVVATNIICDNESDLPNWATNGGPDITATTATDFVAAHPNCHLGSNWNFQWAPDGTQNPGDNTGEAGTPWTTFGPTDGSGTASTNIPSTDSGVLTWLREVWQDGYVPFTFTFNNHTNVDDMSAEMYCNDDVLNYDNLESIDGAQAGNTYYCVAFNASTTTAPVTDPTCTDDQHLDNHVCVANDDGGGTSTTTVEVTTNSDNAGGGSGGGGGGGGGVGCGPGFAWSPSAHTCVAQGQVLGASCGIYVDKFLSLNNPNNDSATVTKVQNFLNKWMGANLLATGTYDQNTFNAVKVFQTKYTNQVLKPWGENTPATGLVYLSTIYQMNMMECPALTLQYPTLIPWNLNSSAQ